LVRSLALRDSWYSAPVLVTAFVAVLLPLVAATAVFNVVPSYTRVEGTFIAEGASDVVAAPSGGGSQTTLKMSMPEFLRIYGSFLSGISVAYYALFGVMTVYVVARPVEMRYFFVELTFVGSRLRLVALRLLHVLPLMLVSAAASSLGLSAILWVLRFPGTILDAYAFALLISSASALISIPLSVLLSVVTRSSSTSILLLLGFTALCVIASAWIDVARSPIDASMIVARSDARWIGLPVNVALLAADLVAVDRVEYR